MAGNSPSQPPPPPSPPLSASNNQDPIRYWCYHCNKRVPVETLPDHSDVICFECKNGFVESISVPSNARQVSSEETPAFGNEFVQILRLIAQAAREDDEPPPPPSHQPAWDNDNDYLRIELGGLNDDSYIVTDEDQDSRDQFRARWYYEDYDDDNEHEEEIDNSNEEDIENRIDEQIENRIEEDIENRNEEQIENRIEEEVEDEHDYDFDRRNRREILRRRLREVAGRAASRHNRIMDWAEMLIGLEDQSIEFRLQAPGYDDDDDDDDDAYVGNPGDYVDAAGYDALLQRLAETDSFGKRGAPPAAKSAVENLHTVEVKSTDIEICAVCKDRVFNIEDKIVKQLECGHMYHGECIIPWLDSRNTCPVCRFELPTDDPEYEEDRKRRLVAIAAATNPIDHGCSSSSGAGG